MTRWNSTYDSVAKVRPIIADPELEVKFDKLCDDLISKRLLPAQKTFVHEYVEVMAPIACALDVLQGEKNVGLGYFLPTLAVVKTQLHQLLERDRPAPLVVCQSLVQKLLDGINTRFGDVFDDLKAQLSAMVQPKFKLDWIDGNAQKAEMANLLKRYLYQQARREGRESASVPVVQVPNPVTATKNFFSCLTSRRQNANTPAARPDTSIEIDRYLTDSSTELSSLSNYPHIRQLYMQLNTGLPASAAVERLFSLSGRVFSPLRSTLSSKHFEILVFLRLCK